MHLPKVPSNGMFKWPDGRGEGLYNFLILLFFYVFVEANSTPAARFLRCLPIACQPVD
ncbi:hypothetical protein LMG29542_04372 [Paraburkholderia humisilvae]|uniref:Uncharacterized protein n=1 Tax=Paraburkholderia humisilvae TaxID=627669 RepID=A0A6J5EAX8_9BURK|nr:hypothetical protein LMG29542_04372 [Paraburkholderia humisilvae]